MIYLSANTPCTTNLTIWVDSNISHEIIIKAQHLVELRNSINREVTRRSKPALTWNSNIQNNEIQYATSWDEYFSKINAVRTTMNTQPAQPIFNWVYTNVAVGNYILAARLIELRAKVNDLEDDCVCNCNHCPCNCNHCACNCNHSPCSCNCNRCSCDGHWCSCDGDWCSCDCNYCSCNCNRPVPCACQCNHCPCQCNHSCPCNCNYGSILPSDKKLKINIQYF